MKDLRLPSGNRLEALKGDRTGEWSLRVNEQVLLEEFLKPAGMTQVEAARRMGIPLNRLNEVIRGKRGATADTALRLAKLLDTSAEIWLGLQNDWDLWQAAQAMGKAG